MQTHHQNRSKSSYHPALAGSKPATAKAPLQIRQAARPQLPRFRVVKAHPEFRMNQEVHLYTGPTYDIDVPGEVGVTVVPGVGPFVGLTPDYLERIG